MVQTGSQVNGIRRTNTNITFDNFTDTAHHSFTHLAAKVLENRKLLKTTMELFGFIAFDTEWWHYSWSNNQNYEVIDLSFTKLKRIVKQFIFIALVKPY